MRSLETVPLRPLNLIPIPIRHDNIGPNTAMPTDGYYLEMPVGTEIASVGSIAGNLGVLALMDPNGLKVKHPLLLIRVGATYDLPIGVLVGRCLGMIDGKIAVFQQLPWPTGSKVVVP